MTQSDGTAVFSWVQLSDGNEPIELIIFSLIKQEKLLTIVTYKFGEGKIFVEISRFYRSKIVVVLTKKSLPINLFFLNFNRSYNPSGTSENQIRF